MLHRTEARRDFATIFLTLGYSDGVPWFLEFSPDAQVSWHTEPRFYAVGSGGHFASVTMAPLRHYLTDDLTLEGGKMLAYRTIDATIEVSKSGVGPPVQIAICDADGPHSLTEDEMEAVHTRVDRWKMAKLSCSHG